MRGEDVKKKISISSIRSLSIKYHLKNANGSYQRVYKTFFPSTLGYNHKNDTPILRILRATDKIFVHSPLPDGSRIALCPKMINTQTEKYHQANVGRILDILVKSGLVRDCFPNFKQIVKKYCSDIGNRCSSNINFQHRSNICIRSDSGFQRNISYQCKSYVGLRCRSNIGFICWFHVGFWCWSNIGNRAIKKIFIDFWKLLNNVGNIFEVFLLFFAQTSHVDLIWK